MKLSASWEEAGYSASSATKSGRTHRIAAKLSIPATRLPPTPPTLGEDGACSISGAPTGDPPALGRAPLAAPDISLREPSGRSRSHRRGSTPALARLMQLQEPQEQGDHLRGRVPTVSPNRGHGRSDAATRGLRGRCGREDGERHSEGSQPTPGVSGEPSAACRRLCASPGPHLPRGVPGLRAPSMAGAGGGRPAGAAGAAHAGQRCEEDGRTDGRRRGCAPGSAVASFRVNYVCH